MKRDRDCVAVIPCLNEQQTIRLLVKVVRTVLPKVIVVDDGSTDATATEAASAGAEVLRLPQNRGKGAALRFGLNHAHSRGFTWALTLDGDGQHDPNDIPALLSRAEASNAALVVGNRMSDAASMPWLRRNVNRWMSRRLSKLAGQPLEDSQCGLRLLNLSAWSGLRLSTEHFEFESEMLIEFAKAGQRIRFVPVRTIYGSTQSRIRPLSDTWRWLRWWIIQLSAGEKRPGVVSWLSRFFSGLQDNPRSVGQFHLSPDQTGIEGKTV